MNLINRIYLLIAVTVACIALGSCATPSSQLKDGEYYGYQFNQNLPSKDDPDAFWYYSGVLSIHQGKVTLKQFPRYKSGEKVEEWSADGGFPEYNGEVIIDGDRVLVTLKLVLCDYCLDNPVSSSIERKYLIRFIDDGSFELNGVEYRAKPDPKFERNLQ